MQQQELYRGNATNILTRHISIENWILTPECQRWPGRLHYGCWHTWTCHCWPGRLHCGCWRTWPCQCWPGRLHCGCWRTWPGATSTEFFRVIFFAEHSHIFSINWNATVLSLQEKFFHRRHKQLIFQSCPHATTLHGFWGVYLLALGWINLIIINSLSFEGPVVAFHAHRAVVCHTFVTCRKVEQAWDIVWVVYFIPLGWFSCNKKCAQSDNANFLGQQHKHHYQ